MASGITVAWCVNLLLSKWEINYTFLLISFLMQVFSCVAGSAYTAFGDETNNLHKLHLYPWFKKHLQWFSNTSKILAGYANVKKDQFKDETMTSRVPLVLQEPMILFQLYYSFLFSFLFYVCFCGMSCFHGVVGTTQETVSVLFFFFVFSCFLQCHDLFIVVLFLQYHERCTRVEHYSHLIVDVCHSWCTCMSYYYFFF